MIASVDFDGENEKLEFIRREVKKRVSSKRYNHILSVERTARSLASFLMPNRIFELSIAALLHDITKELSVEENIALIKASDFPLNEEDIYTEGILHSFSAPIVCQRDFSEFVNEDILSAIKNHTVGEENMSLFDKIIFISDYIEETRTHSACVSLREWLFSNLEKCSTHKEREICLSEACLSCIKSTEAYLSGLSLKVNSRMLLTKASLENILGEL